MKLIVAVLILVVSAAAQSAKIHTEAAITPALKTYTAFPDAPSHLRSQWEKKPPNWKDGSTIYRNDLVARR